MAYMLLIMEKHGDRQKRTLEEGRARYDRMVRYAGDLKSRGLLLSADALSSDSDGSRLTVKNGKRMVVDGPFVETKEMVGGYFLLGCASKDEAVAIASECPAAEWATVEVRRIATCYE